MIPDNFIQYNPILFAKGKRGLVYKFKKNNKVYALKIKNPDSKASYRLEIEASFLKKLNKYKIGPKLVDYGNDYICYKFIEGITLKEYLKNNKNISKVLNEIKRQCKILDKLNINKEEFHKPLKNIIINKNKPILIDFERCHYTNRPKNINQFNEFLRRIININIVNK